MVHKKQGKLYDYMKSKAVGTGQHLEKVMFFDTVDEKNVELSICYELVYDDLSIIGDDCEVYELIELKLLDEQKFNW